ncbi:MnhB domain-containing protein [Gluconacetobacter takamatsuzukensis]|uniref:Sodium:proton antiporter n=1 Tax=Gluconacetobacter takamatsuzukensis TaxID=1286190 RepID=A0A7W4KFR9_9PROT|nr:MnhB domain-containing protein [Gluconacetobacter takamatsuzukensis]MBB2206117.1 sodium:proton antiporter [Gluconacetobacter takamatsuzukensis]
MSALDVSSHKAQATIGRRGIILRVAFVILAVGLAVVAWPVVHAMPQFGSHPLPYGDRVNAIGPAERHITNMVSAINFDIRGIDTLGEEFMLLCAVTGGTVLLRGGRGEDRAASPGHVKGRANHRPPDSLRLLCRVLAPLTMLFGLYLAINAMLTPGGGFQGGVVIASALLLIYLAEGYAGWRDALGSEFFDAIEGLGAALYALCGFVSMGLGLPYLAAFLPFGTLKNTFSGGSMLIVNLGVTLAVAGGFATLLIEFMEETRTLKPGDDPDE